MENIEIHNADCPCKKTECERHGNCAACREHHLNERKRPPVCERTKARGERKERRKR